MANTLFITATEARSGKSAVCLGVMEMLLRKIEKVGFFRPIINTEDSAQDRDKDIELISSYFNLDIPYEKMYGCTSNEARKLISSGKKAEVVERIIKKYDELKERYDFILCEGTDFASSNSAFEFDINAAVGKNLGCPVLLVTNANQKTTDETVRSVELALGSLKEKGCHTIAIIVNRVEQKMRGQMSKLLKKAKLTEGQLIYSIPDEATLGKPTVGEIADALGAKVLYGEGELQRHVHHFGVAAMQLRNFLTRIEDESLIITPGDRADVIVGCLATLSSRSKNKIAGLLLTGGLIPEDPIWNLIKSSLHTVSILSVKENTFPTAIMAQGVHAKILPDDKIKITKALSVFEKAVNTAELGDKVITTQTNVVTPKMFEYKLVQDARADKKHIVLPEGEEERILRASEILLNREIVDITLLGNEEVIREKIRKLNLHLDDIAIIDPSRSSVIDDYAQTYYELRKHKGITTENARDVMCDVSFFGAMTVYKRQADGMVSGAIHSTAATVRPALEIIKTKPGVSLVSSIFFMCLRDGVIVYGDCAVNPNPDASQLAQIALSSARTAKAFGVEPIVAMLSYSSGKSGKGEDVEKIREATNIAQEMRKTSYPGLKIEGPIQYDAAIDARIAKTKLPESEVAGKATVFIFPDLNTGNNTYKAVQQSAGVIAVGPVLQGLKYPVNDLSRGCTIPDIVNTVAITAIQAQKI